MTRLFNKTLGLRSTLLKYICHTKQKLTWKIYSNYF
jgi:hypothetical protein